MRATPTSTTQAVPTNRALIRRQAMSTWENEGGASLDAMPNVPNAGNAVNAPNAPDALDALDAPMALTESAEADQLRMRVIALENLVIALLADASDHQRAIARVMGDFISPRPGYTPHPLTLRAAEAMRSLVERADRFRLDATP